VLRAEDVPRSGALAELDKRDAYCGNPNTRFMGGRASKNTLSSLLFEACSARLLVVPAT